MYKKIQWSRYAMITYTTQTTQAIKHPTHIYFRSQNDNQEKIVPFQGDRGHLRYI